MPLGERDARPAFVERHTGARRDPAGCEELDLPVRRLFDDSDERGSLAD